MAANGKHWVMLVAGSKTWSNYRHQADVCHAYQIIHQNGIPDEQIVVMMYDDIANNDDNPYPGNIINRPNGPNVYPGVPKDYTGGDVTPENFLAALKGERQNSQKKVISSGENDTIFIYLSDHGSPGIFCFPNNTLHANDLIETIKEMARNKKFSKMVIYMESCFSASMFTQLPDNIHVYAVTAAGANERSYACYFDPVRKTYLADVFSALWMYYTETNDLDKVTFLNQFSYLQQAMNTSHPCCFGDMTAGEKPISEFLRNTPRSIQESAKAQQLVLTDLTQAHEVPFKILENQINIETDEDRKQDLIRKLDALHQIKAKIEGTVETIKRHFPDFAHEDEDYSQMDLHSFKTVAEHFRTTCFDWHEEEMALSHTHVFARLCARGVKTERIIEVITKVSSL
ncbi:legumain-like isoform X2 [Puntigrus tetrazona]|uniref:legumain-like isoform X2 n=1 Tax=Puntigrus tetrazona TaxID=1606681 RepID=UPI001C89F351|nr:legumain-like isoform X2 [Puntigrus tetrazona]XP_043108002.1 legumain-like isoform X2 [Puntigrus tetrazona]